MPHPIREKYPTSHYDPDPECKRCKGMGERYLLGDWRACICLFVEADIRDKAAETLRTTAQKLRKELDEQGDRHPMIQTTMRLMQALIEARDAGRKSAIRARELRESKTDG